MRTRGSVDQSGSPSALSELEDLLVQSIDAIGLDASEATRTLEPNPCIGTDGDEGYSLEFFFAEPNPDRGFAYLEALERNWEDRTDIEITR